MNQAGERDTRARAARARAGALSIWACLAALTLGACAARVVEPPTGAPPRHPDFLYPAVPPTLADPGATAWLDRGWRFLQAGEVRDAEQAFGRAIKLNPSFYPAAAGLGYARLAERAYEPALSAFDGVLRQATGYVPALVGRGDALLGASRPREALESFQRALELDPALGEVKRRIEVVSLRLQQDALAAARRAADSGDYESARRAYLQAIESSPDSAFLYRDLAGVERLSGNGVSALAHLRKAADLEPTDARTWVQMGELLEAQQDFNGAAAAYGRAAELEPGAAAAERVERAKRRASLAQLPAAFQHIPESPQVTRADLAALLATRVPRVVELSGTREAVVMTDVAGHWAAEWIRDVVRGGLMEVYPNHEFHPDAALRRADLAIVVSRALQAIGRSQPRQYQEWQRGRPAIADVAADNVNYPAVALAVTAGVMPLLGGDTFQPARQVSGAEALDVLGRLEVLSR